MSEPKILYISPNGDFSGYARAARDYIAALDSVGCNIVTRSLNYDGSKRKLEGRELELQSKDLQDIKICIQHTTPIEMTPHPNLFNIGYFAWETDRLPAPFAEAAEKMDLLLVPCEENLKAARVAGVTKPIEVIPHTFPIEKYSRPLRPFDVGGPNTFKFLSIAQLSKKKGIDSLLKAYFCEFESSDDVLLILKLYVGPNDGEAEQKQMVDLIQKVKEGLRLTSTPPVLLVSTLLEEEDVDRLYPSSHCYVLPSRGEGWSITAFDAMAYGIPPIVTGWAGPTEFMTDNVGWLVSYSLTPCFGQTMGHNYMYTGKEKWAEPDMTNLMFSMREAFDMWKQRDANNYWNGIVKDGKARARQFDYKTVGTKMKNTIYKYAGVK